MTRLPGCLLLLGLLLGAWAQGKEMPDPARVAIQPTRYANMYEVYQANKERGLRTYITSDSVLHSTHVLLDYTLRAAELQAFDKHLRAFTHSAFTAAAAKADEEAHTAYFMAPPPYGYDRVAAYFGVAERLLNPDAPIPTKRLAGLIGQELALIQAHKEVTLSPILGVTEDYTQYVPRGHYTRSEHFKQYFLAMLWYGRAGFAISGEKSPLVPLTTEEKRANALAAVTMARFLTDDPETLKQWQAVYRPTAFLVGAADELIPPEVMALANDNLGQPLPGGWTADAQARTDRFIAAVIAARPPRIISTVQSDQEKSPPVALRLMGQRFVVDSYIFQQLVHPRVPNRMMPTGLDVMAVFGSPTALELLKARGEPAKYPTYTDQLAKLQAMLNEYQEQTAYALWLRAIRDLVSDPAWTGKYPDGYVGRRRPAYWNTALWKAKQLNAGLGSWAELRHDTILYVKPSLTTLGSSVVISEPGKLQFYIEPEPLVYRDLAVLLAVVRANLEQEHAFPAELADNYAVLARLLGSLQRVSAQATLAPGEKANTEAPSNDDDARILLIGDALRRVETLSPELKAAILGPGDSKAALIADVHTDPNSGSVLEVGTGDVYTITVPVPIANGIIGTACGPIFTYHEFAQPMGDRLTDEAWQAMLAGGKALAPFILGGK